MTNHTNDIRNGDITHGLSSETASEAYSRTGSQTVPQTSDEIRDNIEHTRRKMGDKLDQIQERLDPRNLRDQTQEVVRNVVTDGTDAMMDYVRENTRELGSSLTGALKRHPLPAALIGLGLVWLMVDSVNGSSDDSDEWSRRRDSDRYRPEGRYYNYERAAYDPAYRGEYGSGSYSDQYSQGQYAQGYSGAMPGTMRDPMRDSARGSYGQNDHDASSLKEKAVDAVSGAAENVRDTVKEWGQEVGEKAGEIGGEIRERVGDFRHDAQGQAQRFGNQAGYRARRASEDNPLMTGAIAFAIGAAAGLLLPPTRKENELMGEARAQFMSSARETADKAMQRAEEVVQEVRPTVEQAAHDITESVKRTGQDAATRIKEAAQETKSKVEHEVKNEMDKAKDKSGDASNSGTSTSGMSTTGASTTGASTTPARSAQS